MTSNGPSTHDPWIPVALIPSASGIVLVGLALLSSGTTRLAAVILLGLLAPAAGIGGAFLAGRRLRRRMADLESVIEGERGIRRSHDRVYARFIEGLRAPSATTTDVVRRVENLAVAAQIDADDYHPNPMALRLDRRVDRVITAAEQPGMEISADVRAVAVWCDPAAIRQIVCNVLDSAGVDGATTVRVDVGERNGLGILSITDDRRSDRDPEPATGGLLGSGKALSRRIIPALAEHQGATTTTVRTLGWTNTIIRFPVATPAQVATMRETPGSLFDPSRST